MKKTLEWYCGDICGHIANYIVHFFWNIPDMCNYLSCADGFYNGFDETPR